MFVVRPARPADLDAIERMARATDPMLHSLPPDREVLRARIDASVASFGTEVVFPGEESYLLVLEDTDDGRLHGTSRIVATTGHAVPFAVYRNDVIIQASRELKLHSRVHALTLSHELSGHTQLGGFYVDAQAAGAGLPALLSRARLLLALQHPERFHEDMVSVLPGVTDDAGRSPFWDALGGRFFRMEFRQAEFLSGARDKTFIAEMMPHHPIYVPLLPEDAQRVMGQAHPRSGLPLEILSDEGFEGDRFIDLFDGGPVLCARRALTRSAREGFARPARRGMPPADATRWHLAATCGDAHEFRCMALRLPEAPPEELVVPAPAADLLRLEPGASLRCVPL